MSLFDLEHFAFFAASKLHVYLRMAASQCDAELPGLADEHAVVVVSV